MDYEDVVIRQTVNFKRNTVSKLNNTKVAFVKPLTEEDKDEVCIIEFPDGWIPNQIRINQFGLDATKKYLFVKASELTLV